MNKSQLIDLINSLRASRKIFHSEADFQHALAWEIHKAFPNAKIRLEIPIQVSNSTYHLDLLVRNGHATTGIELKYKKLL